VVDQIREQAAATPGVRDVRDVRARWLGHVIRAGLAISVPPEESAHEAAATAQAVRERLTERVAHVADATVEVRAWLRYAVFEARRTTKMRASRRARAQETA
jgi:divalent metal cation (Fe/Co/Zn/Cd) transporter